MRRGPAAVMSAVTVAVVAVSFRAGEPATIAAVRTTRSEAALTRALSLPPSAPPTPAGAGARRISAAPTPRLVRPGSRAPLPVPVSPRPQRLRPSPSAARSPAPSAVTVNGAAVDTAYGPVQVQITVRAHRIVAARAIVYPQDSSRDRAINDRAIPDLNQETLNAQSAQIDTVSGATYTSDGYRQSLQSALDAAHQAGAW